MDGAHADPLMLDRRTVGGLVTLDRRTDGGLVTLEWLLLVAAVAGLAAASTLAVQRVLDDTAEVPADPHVRVIDADIAAALLAEEAEVAVLEPPYIDLVFAEGCQTDLPSAFGDVVDDAVWTPPVTATTTTIAPPPPPPPPSWDTRAKCAVTLRPDLGP